MASRVGSHVDIWSVVIDPVFLTASSIVGSAYAAEIKQGINGACRFLRESVRSALGTGSLHLPEFRREPVLEAWDGNREPLVDIELEHERQRLRLRELTARVLGDLARPVGRSAARLTIVLEGEQIAVIDEDAKRRWLAGQITAAISNMRGQARMAGLRS